MKIEIKVIKEVDVKTLHVKAGVRYWEDSTVNDAYDTEFGDNIPCKKDSLWAPIIDIDTGIITNWQKGKTASIHYKVCDAGVYIVKDIEGNEVAKKDGYVPSILQPGGNGYGDYIIMAIDEKGEIEDWDKNEINEFFDFD